MIPLSRYQQTALRADMSLITYHGMPHILIPDYQGHFYLFNYDLVVVYKPPILKNSLVTTLAHLMLTKMGLKNIFGHLPQEQMLMIPWNVKLKY